MVNKVDETNFMLYAAKHYDNPQCFDTLEFYDDMKRFKYLKRLFNRYEECGELKERLIINHLIVLYNVFGPEHCTRMLFYKLKEYYKYLVPFLILLGYLPQQVTGVGLDNKTIITSDIELDSQIIEVLRQI